MIPGHMIIYFQSGVVRQAVSLDPRTITSLLALKELAWTSLEKIVCFFQWITLFFMSSVN